MVLVSLLVDLVWRWICQGSTRIAALLPKSMVNTTKQQVYRLSSKEDKELNISKTLYCSIIQDTLGYMVSAETFHQRVSDAMVLGLPLPLAM